MKKTNSFHKIKNIDSAVMFQSLAMIITKARNLAGFKEAIPDASKTDISKMILSKYKNLSLEEIDKAFEIDRHSANPIKHFQLFNSTYVAKILESYHDWKRNLKTHHNLSQPKAIEKTFTEKEKEEFREKNIRNIFDDIVDSGFSHDAWLIYEYVNAPEKENDDYKKLLHQRQMKAFIAKERDANPFQKVKQNNQNGYVINRCKAIIVCNYLKSFVDDYQIFKSKILFNDGFEKAKIENE